MPHFPKPFFKKSRQQWYVEIQRHQHCLGPDREEAFRLYYELMNQPETPAAPQPIDATQFAAIVDAFLEWVKKHRSADTFEWYRYRLERFCQRHPTLRAAELRPYHVQQWVDSYPALRRTSQRNYVRTVKRCCRWALQQGYLTSDPIRHLEVPGAERREVLISSTDYQQIAQHVRDAAFAELVQVTWETGCRPQESLRVEARHVDLPRQRWVFPKSEAKGKRQPRVVYLTDAAAEITGRLMQRYPTGPLFRNSRGTPWTTDAVNCQFERLRIRMLLADPAFDAEALEAEIAKLLPQLRQSRVVDGKSQRRKPEELRVEARRKVLHRQVCQRIPRYSLYALRHCWATRALQSGLDGLTVAILMGHSDPSTLARVYQHLSHQPEHLLRQAQRAASGDPGTSSNAPPSSR